MSDRVTVQGVVAMGSHGVLDHEKTTPQPFIVDLDLELDLRWAGGSDALADTVDYAAVAADAVSVLHGPSAALIEHLAEKIASACLARSAVEAVTVTVRKPAAPVGVLVDGVAVTVRRERRQLAVISLGANLGDAAATLASAARSIAAQPGVRVSAVSGLVETDPVGGPAQPVFLNAVALAWTRLSPRSLLAALRQIEDDHGRVRAQRWGPRTLDLDLIQVGDPGQGSDQRWDTPELTLPHPRAHERGFVLIPWAQVQPGAMLRRGSQVLAVADLAAALSRPGGPSPGVRPGPAWSPRW